MTGEQRARHATMHHPSSPSDRTRQSGVVGPDSRVAGQPYRSPSRTRTSDSVGELDRFAAGWALVITIEDQPCVLVGLESVTDELCDLLACKAAVKAGDPLAPAQIRALLEEASTLEHGHTCPHGRPTTLVIGRADLDRHFKRR